MQAKQNSEVMARWLCGSCRQLHSKQAPKTWEQGPEANKTKEVLFLCPWIAQSIRLEAAEGIVTNSFWSKAEKNPWIKPKSRGKVFSFYLQPQKNLLETDRKEAPRNLSA